MGQATVSASSVNVRSGPSTKDKLLGRLNKGETFSYSQDKNGWLQTDYMSKTAYVCKKYTTTTSGATSAAPTTESSVPEPSPAPAESTSSAPVSINVSAAVSYNKKRGYSKAKWMEIQNKVGTTADGVPGPNTAKAIAQWQQSHGLKADGKCGPGTLAAMGLDGSTPTTATPSEPTTTPTPSTPTTSTPTATPSTPTTSTPTATETPSAPAAPTTTESSGEKLLSAAQVTSAINYNVGQNLASIWKDIQKVVGTAQTGKIDEVSVQAIASWQQDNGLEADGKFGKKSLAKAGLSKPSAASSGSVEYGTVGPGGLMYASNDYVRKNSDSGRQAKEVVDLQTGKKFTVSWCPPSGTYHSDCTPYDKASTDTVKSIVNPSKSPEAYSYWAKGSSWNWNGHPGALKLRNGVWVACGFHLRPHGSPLGGHPDKPWNTGSPASRPANMTCADDWKPGGHFCLYYSSANRGGTNSCREAVELAKNMQCPE